MNEIIRKSPNNFNIYYLNFPKVYEISMMINNVILASVQTENTKSIEKQLGFSSSMDIKGTKLFLERLKASISADARESKFSSSRVIENLEVKTTKSILLKKIIEKCKCVSDLRALSEGDLIKIDNVKLEFVDENNLRQIAVLRKDALKGFQVEGMEVNNLISSMLQDYSYVLRGSLKKKDNESEKLIIKIPLELQDEFENKYSVDDLLIGHVSIIGLYKEFVREDSITKNTFTYLLNIGTEQQSKDKIFKSDEPEEEARKLEIPGDACHFIDVIALIQDVRFDIIPEKTKSCWIHKLIKKLTSFRWKK